MAKSSTTAAHSIGTAKDGVEIRAGILTRKISLVGGNVSTTSLLVDGSEALAKPTAEFSATISFARPNQQPRGLTFDNTNTIETTTLFKPDANSISAGQENVSVEWVNPVSIRAQSWSEFFGKPKCNIERAGRESRRLIVHAEARKDSPIAGIQVDLTYEIYDGFPVIRKWITVTNKGRRWLKLDDLCIDDVALGPKLQQQIPLTPTERGAGSSVVAFGSESGESGLIAVSEIPSALRKIEDSGAIGYASEFFEWVLGPGEAFVSEPVFHFAYAGPCERTASAVSTPLDRALEGPYLDFLRKHIGVAADSRTLCSPQWCSWSNFGQQINEAIIREQAEIAARCGFSMVLMDQGWQSGLVGTQPDSQKFPDFEGTCRYIRSLGMQVGLWVSCYRSEGSPDLQLMPEARCLPLITRDGGYGMSFSSPWKKFCADDLANVSRKYGISYFKQDFTNIKFGDIAVGHESRTRKESLLRGLRGLLEAQDHLRKAAPGVSPEITHEIYWGTPGVPCDIAALKHAATYHIPPNSYGGLPRVRGHIPKDMEADPMKLRNQLIAGCLQARQRFYDHRGLPLYTVEFYAAHAVNVRGSLSPAALDRQVCSWLMGAPSVFAGDLTSLTKENIEQYHRRFELMKRLERDYGIYRNFQFSGVPAPTDDGWHWWGKLNRQGCGAVVVLRGKGGQGEVAVNVPWVQPERSYRVSALLNERPLGTFKGKQLQAGALRLTLDELGQEILELQAAE